MGPLRDHKGNVDWGLVFLSGLFWFMFYGLPLWWLIHFIQWITS